MVFLLFGAAAAGLRDAVRFPAMDFFEGVSFCEEDCFAANVLPVAPLCSRLLEGAGLVWEVDCPAVALDLEVFVFVLNFCVFCLAVRLFVCCLAGRGGSGLLGACLTVVEGILALKIFDFSTAALFFFCPVAGDPAGNIFEVKKCRC